MEPPETALTPLDDLFLQRAYELAARGTGNTSPNPPVGAVVVRENAVIGEGYHHRAGDPHAEPLALAEAGERARGATLYVSLEPCGHIGRTPPCTQAILAAGISRVVIGALDPTDHGGAAELRARGVEVVVAGDAYAQSLIERFAGAVTAKRPFVALKMAMSLDGSVASRRGAREQLGSAHEQAYVRELRIAHDAVMVGAGTVRVDDPQLTVRPSHHRLRPYVRIVVCENDGVPAKSRVFQEQQGYARSLVLAPGALAARLSELGAAADVVPVGEPEAVTLDLAAAMRALHEREIASVLCEGGPTLAAHLIAARQVDRFYWAIAPRFIASDDAVPVLAPDALAARAGLRFDRVERLGSDVMLGGTFADV